MICDMNKVKISINIVCIIILAVVIASCALDMGALTSGLIDGMESVDSGNNTSTESSFLAAVSLKPEGGIAAEATDSLKTVDGGKIPVVVTKALVEVPEQEVPVSTLISLTILSLVILGFYIALVIAFLWFLLRVNRGTIFDDCNVRLLRRIGIYLLVIVLAKFSALLMQAHCVMSLLPALESYSVSRISSLAFGELIIALNAILMSLVWKRGLELKHDQELTI